MAQQSSIWVDSMWATRQIEVSFEVDGVQISKRVSIGMTVKSSNKTSSTVLHKAIDRALSKASDEEYNAMMSPTVVKKEVDKANNCKSAIESSVDSNANNSDEQSIVMPRYEKEQDKLPTNEKEE